MMKKWLFIIILIFPIILQATILSDSLFSVSARMKPLARCEYLFNFLEDNYRNYPEESKKIAEKVLVIAKRNKLLKQQAEAYTYLGMLAKNTAEFQTASDYYLKAEEISKKANDSLQ